jgi:hypothetical protein
MSGGRCISDPAQTLKMKYETEQQTLVCHCDGRIGRMRDRPLDTQPSCVIGARKFRARKFA